MAVNACVFRSIYPLRYQKNQLSLPQSPWTGGALRTRIFGWYPAIVRSTPPAPPATSRSVHAASAAAPGTPAVWLYSSFCCFLCSRSASSVPFWLYALAIGYMAILGAAILAAPIEADTVSPGAYRFSVCMWVLISFLAHVDRSFPPETLHIYKA